MRAVASPSGIGPGHHDGLGYKIEEKTILCIKDQIENNCPYRFFTKLVSTVIGRRPALEDKRHFWHSVVYHNLIVEPLAGPRQCPSPDLWKRSLLTLPAIFETHRPELCIALGFRLWRELRGGLAFEAVPGFPDHAHCGVVYSKAFDCFFVGMKHPSGRGFSKKEWTTWIDQFVANKWPQKSFVKGNGNVAT